MINEEEVESFNFWKEKEWWCKPWSILLSGIIFIALSWLWPHKIWLTIFISIIIITWWILFLWLVPISYRQNFKQDFD